MIFRLAVKRLLIFVTYCKMENVRIYTMSDKTNAHYL